MRSIVSALSFTLLVMSCSSGESEPEARGIDETQLVRSLEISELSPEQAVARDELVARLASDRADEFNRQFLQDVLEDRYVACLVNSSFDPGGVQVIWGEDGSPMFVKTGRDVPAELHGPCWTAIGGDTNGMSSRNEDG